MLKLHGAPLSNYYNMVKTALLEKGLDYEAVIAPPSQEEDFLTKSPMGKIPCLETDGGFVAESLAIIEYLEEIQPEPALLPADPYARAKVRELMLALELYVELVARRGFGALRGRPVAEDVVEALKADLPKGIAAVQRLVKFSPWIAGEQFTYADLVGYFTFTLASLSAKANAEIDLFEQLPGSKAWFDAVAARDSVKQAVADQKR
jgi:glutathione S-transferase|tara:strand:- start:168 stop:785 length:618 start_codon:yes stop_codon:yes gene_type:complete